MLEPQAVGGGVPVAHLLPVAVEPDVPGGGDRLNQIQGALQFVDDQHRLQRQRQIARFDPGDVEHLVDQAEQMPSASEDVLDTLLLLTGQVVHLQELPEAEDGVQGSAQLMAHPGQELIFRPVRLFGLVFGSAQILFPLDQQDAGSLERLAQAADLVTARGRGHQGESPSQQRGVFFQARDPPRHPGGEEERRDDPAGEPQHQ